MSVFLSSFEWLGSNPGWLIALSGLFGAIVSYWLQKNIDRRYNIKEMRRKEYIHYFNCIAAKMHYQTISSISPVERAEYDRLHLSALLEMRKSFYTLAIISPEDVFRRLGRFQMQISAESVDRNSTVLAEVLAALVGTIRNDGFGKSKLKKEELLDFIKTKI